MELIQILRGNLPTIISEIVREVDYDIWKAKYDYTTCDDLDDADANMQILEDIILAYAEEVL